MHAYLFWHEIGATSCTFEKNKTMIVTQCNAGKVSLIDNNIVFIDIPENQELNVIDIEEFIYTARNLAVNEKVYTIINYGSFAFPTAEAITYCLSLSSDEYILARAIIVKDLGQLILAKGAKKNAETNQPVEVFKNTNEAETWVRKMRAKEIINSKEFTEN